VIESSRVRVSPTAPSSTAVGEPLTHCVSVTSVVTRYGTGRLLDVLSVVFFLFFF